MKESFENMNQDSPLPSSTSITIGTFFLAPPFRLSFLLFRMVGELFSAPRLRALWSERVPKVILAYTQRKRKMKHTIDSWVSSQQAILSDLIDPIWILLCSVNPSLPFAIIAVPKFRKLRCHHLVVVVAHIVSDHSPSLWITVCHIERVPD